MFNIPEITDPSLREILGIGPAPTGVAARILTNPVGTEHDSPTMSTADPGFQPGHGSMTADQYAALQRAKDLGVTMATGFALGGRGLRGNMLAAEPVVAPRPRLEPYLASVQSEKLLAAQKALDEIVARGGDSNRVGFGDTSGYQQNGLGAFYPGFQPLDHIPEYNLDNMWQGRGAYTNDNVTNVRRLPYHAEYRPGTDSALAPGTQPPQYPSFPNDVEGVSNGGPLQWRTNLKDWASNRSGIDKPITYNAQPIGLDLKSGMVHVHLTDPATGAKVSPPGGDFVHPNELYPAASNDN